LEAMAKAETKLKTNKQKNTPQGLFDHTLNMN
jgi:hypothetical protein